MADQMTATDQFERARALAARGRRELARRALSDALASDPNNSRAQALKARLDAESLPTSRDAAKSAELFGDTDSKFEAAKRTIHNLIDRDPSDPYLKLQLATIAAREGHREQAIADLRAMLEDHPDDPYVRQSLAGLLGCEYSTLREAWRQWDMALQKGPPLSPAYRTAAYVLARRNAPEKARLALAGAGAVERAVVRTRSLGVNPLSLAFVLLASGAIVLRVQNDLALGLVVMCTATLFAMWVMFANFYSGCFKCFIWWVPAPLFAWFFFGIAKSVPGTEWIVLAIVFGLTDLVGLVVRRHKRRLVTAT